jgi:hypothetical protein
MSGDGIENDPDMRTVVDYVDDRYEKGRVSYVLRGWGKAINDINKKYSKPRLKMTPLVRFSLFALRLYLIMLVVILSYKFYTMVR